MIFFKKSYFGAPAPGLKRQGHMENGKASGMLAQAKQVKVKVSEDLNTCYAEICIRLTCA